MIHRVKGGNGIAFNDMNGVALRRVNTRSHADSDRSDRREPVVLHVTNIPTPYRIPYFRHLRRTLQSAGSDLHVFFLGRGKRRREWRISEDDMSDLAYTYGSGQGKALVGEITRTIADVNPEAVVLAWAMDLIALRVLLHCRLRRIPCVLFTGETSHTAAQRSHAKVRGILRGFFFRMANGFLTYGTRSSEYLSENGVAPWKIATGLNVVDTNYFRENVEALRESGAADQERARYTRPGGRQFSCHLLLVNYMIPGKGISSTFRALKALGRDDIALHVVGSGPREADHRAMIAEEGMEDQVFFHGYKQLDELLVYYAFNDVVLFPSSVDIFGLVMVEAAAAGLPVIASRFSGGTTDVVVDGYTGLVIDPHDIGDYAGSIEELADDPDRRHTMGVHARDRSINYLTLDRSIRPYVVAISRAIGRELYLRPAPAYVRAEKERVGK